MPEGKQVMKTAQHPAAGGSYVRNADGTLKPVAATAEAAAALRTDAEQAPVEALAGNDNQPTEA